MGQILGGFIVDRKIMIIQQIDIIIYNIYIYMDPEHTTHSLTIKTQQTKLTIYQPYIINKFNTKSANIEHYNKQIQKIGKILQQHPQIWHMQWKWANNIYQQQLVKLIRIMPERINKLCLYGCVFATCEILQLILNKFKDLQHLNLCIQPQNVQKPNLVWDLEYQISIQNSIKNLRNFQKSLSLISQNYNKFKQIINLFSPTLINLSLRYTILGKNTKCLKTLLTNCPHLAYLDIGQTQIIDDHFQKIPTQVLNKFSNIVISLKLDCNRITRKTLQLIFPQFFITQQQTKQQKHNNLQILDISRTNIHNIYQKLYYNAHKLKYLNLGYLQLKDAQIIHTHTNQYNKKLSSLQQLVIQYVTLQIKSIYLILSSYPNLHSLTLSNIKSPIQLLPSQQFLIKKQTIKQSIKFIQSKKIKKLNISYNCYVFGQRCIENILKNMTNLQGLKISGNYIDWKDLMSVCEFGRNIQWLEISNLEQLCLQNNQRENTKRQQSKNNQNQPKSKQKITGLKIFTTILDNLTNLKYIQAYQLIDKNQIHNFSNLYQQTKSKQQADFIIVVDGSGPVYYKRQKK